MLIETKFINYECLQMKCTSSHAPRTLVAFQFKKKMKHRTIRISIIEVNV